MPCHPNARRIKVLWPTLLGATFLFCSLLVYKMVIHKDVTCSSQSSCFQSYKYTSASLKKEECNTVCNTRECLEISNYIMNNIDYSADPCTDFYNFACGKFKDKYGANENYSSLESLTVDLYTNIRNVIEKSIEPYGTAMNKLKIVYKSCMNTGSSELRDIQALLDFLNHIGITNWPHLSFNFSFQSPTLPELLGKLNSYKEDVFFRFYISHFDQIISDESNPLRNFRVGPAEITYNEEWEVNELKKAVGSILQQVGLEANAINKTLEEFITVESKIRELLINANDIALCEGKEDSWTYNCLEEKHSNMSLVCRVIDSVVRNGRLTSRYNRSQFEFSCQVGYYIDQLNGIIQSHSDRVTANYIALRVFINNLKNMRYSIRQALKVFIKLPDEIEDDSSTEFDKWKYCTSWIANNMHYPLGGMYVAKMWSKEAADQVNDIVQEFLGATIDLLLRQQWIGESTKEQIIKEVKEEENCINSVIEALRNKTKINLFYRRFIPTNSSFMRNVLMHKRNLFYLTMLYEEDMRYFVEFNPFVVNAYGGDNIYLTFGILLPPIYRYGYPNLFNVAKIGQIVGHEIGHKIFYFLEQSTDVDNDTKENFKEKAECLIDQYFNFELKRIGKYVQGNQTVSENFPDNMSLRVVEKVSEKYLNNMTNDQFTLPGLSYTPEELLYISYAQTWCAVRSIEKEKQYHARDYHSPPEFRIKGAFQNSYRFSEVFKCSKTSYMNLKDKCPVFD